MIDMIAIKRSSFSMFRGTVSSTKYTSNPICIGLIVKALSINPDLPALAINILIAIKIILALPKDSLNLIILINNKGVFL